MDALLVPTLPSRLTLMLINQYYPAGLSRVANYYHGYTPRYIPVNTPPPAYSSPLPKPTYYYLPPSSVQPYGICGHQSSSPIIINNTTCRHSQSVAPPAAAPVPMHVYDPPSYTTTRHVVAGGEIPGMSPSRPQCSLPAPSAFNEGLPSPPLTPALPTPTPSPPPPAAAIAPVEGGTAPHHRSRLSRRRPAYPSVGVISNVRPLPRPPRVSSIVSNAPDLGRATGPPPQRSNPTTLTAPAPPMISSINSTSGSSESTTSDPEVAQRRAETGRNTILNSVRTSHPPLYSDRARTNQPPPPSSAMQERERGPVGITPQAPVTARTQAGPDTGGSVKL